MYCLYPRGACTLSWAVHFMYYSYEHILYKETPPLGLEKKEVVKWSEEHPKRNQELGNSFLIHQFGVHPQTDCPCCSSRNSTCSDQRVPHLKGSLLGFCWNQTGLISNLVFPLTGRGVLSKSLSLASVPPPSVKVTC